MSGGVLCADSLEEISVLLVVKASQWTATKNIDAVLHSDRIPELFQSNRRLSVAQCPGIDEKGGSASLRHLFALSAFMSTVRIG
jgi:hypothetical protein